MPVACSPTEHGSFTAVGYVHAVDGSEHLALVAGPLDALPERAVPVHVHSAAPATRSDELRTRARPPDPIAG